MKPRILLIIFAFIMMFSSCEKESSSSGPDNAVLEGAKKMGI